MARQDDKLPARRKAVEDKAPTPEPTPPKLEGFKIKGCLRGGRIGRSPCPAATKDEHTVEVKRWKTFPNFVCECGYSTLSPTKEVHARAKELELL